MVTFRLRDAAPTVSYSAASGRSAIARVPVPSGEPRGRIAAEPREPAALFGALQMESPAKIERAVMPDVASIKELLRETWHDTYASLLSKQAIERITSEWHDPTLLAEQVQSPDIYFAVAREDKAVVAVITARQLDDAIVVARLYVRPRHQRRGIGRALLESSYRVFGGARKVRLTVEADNQKGVAFHTKQGFREVARGSEEIAGARLETVVMQRAL